MFSMLAPSLTTGKHTLKYFYTSVSGDKDFTAIGLIDDVQFMYVDINTRKASPKTEWMRQNEKSDHWKRQTGLLIEQHQWILNNIWTENRSNLTRYFASDMHTYQITYGCEWNDETGETKAFRQYGYDGEDFLFLDLKREKWISPVKYGFNTQERCNNETFRLHHWKYYLEIDCIEALKKFLQLGESNLKKTGIWLLSVITTLIQSLFLCHVTGFYPSNVTITWMKNGQKDYEDVKVGTLLPNEDGTFQKTVALKAEADDWKKNEYICVVKHQSKTIRKRLIECEIRANNKRPAPVGMTAFVAVPVVILLLVITVLGYLLYKKKWKSGEKQ
uniref:Ig-like domain-containing protein n=1 Tax=Cyprinus carpio TaxID=7962 RepID=A0A8C2F5L3_CYPCA